MSGGYESGAFRPAENSGASAPPDGQNQRPSYSGSGGGWNGANRQASQGKPGGFRPFNKFAGGARGEVARDFNLDPPTLYKVYVGTGNEDAPEEALNQLREIRDMLERNGYIARTSVFKGPEKAVFAEAKKREILLPWQDFDENKSKLTFTSEEAKWLARKYIPAYAKAEEGEKKALKYFLALKIRLLCGQNLKSPAQFMVTWTEDGCEHIRDRGPRTGFGIPFFIIAHEMRIPIFNVAKPGAKDRIAKHLQLELP